MCYKASGCHSIPKSLACMQSRCANFVGSVRNTGKRVTLTSIAVQDNEKCFPEKEQKGENGICTVGAGFQVLAKRLDELEQINSHLCDINRGQS